MWCIWKIIDLISCQNKNRQGVCCWRWRVFLQKDRNGGTQWLVQWGSVTRHANDRSAAGSAGSPPHCYTLVCSRSKAAPRHCDRPTETGRENMLLHCAAAHPLTDWSGEGNFNCCWHQANRQMPPHEPTASLKAHNRLQNASFNQVLDSHFLGVFAASSALTVCNKTGYIHSVLVTN